MGAFSDMLSMLGGGVSPSAQAMMDQYIAGIRSTATNAAAQVGSQIQEQKMLQALYSGAPSIDEFGNVIPPPWTAEELQQLAQATYTAAIAEGATLQEATEMASGVVSATAGSVAVQEGALAAVESALQSQLSSALALKVPDFSLDLPSFSALPTVMPGSFNAPEISGPSVNYEDWSIPIPKTNISVNPPTIVTNTFKCLSSSDKITKLAIPIPISVAPPNLPGLSNFIMATAKGSVKSFLFYLEPFDRILSVAVEMTKVTPPQQMQKAMKAMRDLLDIIQNFPSKVMQKLVDYFMKDFKMPDIFGGFQRTLNLIDPNLKGTVDQSSDAKQKITESIVSALSSVSGIVSFLKSPTDLVKIIKDKLAPTISSARGELASAQKAADEALAQLETQIKLLLVSISFPVIFIAAGIFAAMKIVSGLPTFLLDLAQGKLGEVFKMMAEAVQEGVTSVFTAMGLAPIHKEHQDDFDKYMTIGQAIRCLVTQVTGLIQNLPMSVAGDIPKILAFSPNLSS